MGKINIQDVDARVVDKFIATLQKTKVVVCWGMIGKIPKMQFNYWKNN